MAWSVKVYYVLGYDKKHIVTKIVKFVAEVGPSSRVSLYGT